MTKGRHEDNSSFAQLAKYYKEAFR